MTATLKTYRTRFLHRNIDLRNVTVKQAIEGRSIYYSQEKPENHDNLQYPEREALWFYLQNHAMASLSRLYDPAEPLAPEHRELVDRYHDTTLKSVMRMYTYLLLICTRETRHAKKPKDVLANPKYAKLKDWYMTYHGSDAGKAIKMLTNSPPAATMGVLTEMYCDLFYKSPYASGYGGKAWGQIADVLRQFVHGEITAEMMMDTAFTLCHNNGPIFNKGMLFHMYNESAIREILDVQRAGMIPAYIRDRKHKVGLWGKYAGGNFVNAEMEAYVEKAEGLSLDFTASVDWGRVMELGAMGSYLHLIKPKAKSAAELAKEKMEAEKKAKAQALFEASKYQIMPGVYAQKETPVRTLETA